MSDLQSDWENSLSSNSCNKGPEMLVKNNPKITFGATIPLKTFKNLQEISILYSLAVALTEIICFIKLKTKNILRFKLISMTK